MEVKDKVRAIRDLEPRTIETMKDQLIDGDRHREIEMRKRERGEDEDEEGGVDG